MINLLYLFHWSIIFYLLCICTRLSDGHGRCLYYLIIKCVLPLNYTVFSNKGRLLLIVIINALSICRLPPSVAVIGRVLLPYFWLFWSFLFHWYSLLMTPPTSSFLWASLGKRSFFYMLHISCSTCKFILFHINGLKGHH